MVLADPNENITLKIERLFIRSFPQFIYAKRMQVESKSLCRKDDQIHLFISMHRNVHQFIIDNDNRNNSKLLSPCVLPRKRRENIGSIIYYLIYLSMD